MFIGLLMIADEDDVLERTLNHNAKFVDKFYVLDGSVDQSRSALICCSHPKFGGYLSDDMLPKPPYPKKPVDGYRQALLDRAYDEHGYDHWFLLLHGDEMWTGLPSMPGYDGFIFPLPFYFPREGEPWDDERHPLDQLHWNLSPGWPEFRLFRGGSNVFFDPEQHFNVTPLGLSRITHCPLPIKHYPYRAPRVQRYRAERHRLTGFDPDNYEHIRGEKGVYWTDAMIERRQRSANFTNLAA